MAGIVTDLIDVEVSRGAPDVFVAAARGPDTALMGYQTGATIAGSGAALGKADARAAAIGECLERYAACVVDGSALVVSSYDEIMKSGRRAHHPSAWALFDGSQKTGYPTFTTDLVLAWSEAWELSSRAPIFVPACMARLSSSALLRQGGANVICPAVSTGCACAASVEEAVLKGILELIERDAFMIVWRNRLEIAEVLIDADCGLFQTYTKKFARPGLEYRIWQTTLDFSVHSFFGILFDRRSPTPRMIVGGAASPDPERAVLKTLCELVQGLSWLEYVGWSAEQEPLDFTKIRNFTDRAHLYASHDLSDAYSFLFHNPHTVRLSSLRARTVPLPTLLDESIGELIGKGFQPCAVDLTSDDVRACGYTVTRAIVPGLETMDGDHRLQMLGGRRWQDVPVALGLRSRPTRLNEINPYPHPYP